MSSLISSAKRKAMSFSLQHGFKNTLLVATRTDPASINIANSLIGKYDWKELLSENGNSILQAKTYDPSNNLFLWIVNQRLLHLNHPDVHFQTALTQSIESPPEIDEVLFLSRHQAASGQLSLTVHPIGVPWVTDVTDVGGLPGRCSPPNPRISSLYRSIMERTKEQGLSDTFQVTLEATHHGPHVDKPTCFVEIGSTESEWSNTEAGMVWADCLADQFSICCKDGNTVDESPISEEAIDQRMKLVAISIGGGHYVPKLNDMVSSRAVCCIYVELRVEFVL